MRGPEARTDAPRSASKRRAIARTVGGRRRGGGHRADASRSVDRVHARTHSTLSGRRIGARIRRPRRRRRPRRARDRATRRSPPESMTSFAFVFPGQGPSPSGMGRALAAASPAAAAVFATADEALGEPISNLAWEGPEDRLNRTENAQPALLATSIAYLAAAHERASAAGHDAARTRASTPATRWASTRRWSPSSALSLPDGVRLVRERGRQMQACGRGPRRRDGRDPRPRRRRAARSSSSGRSAHGVFAVANRNSPGQVVVSGERAAIEAAAEIAKELGAQAGDRPARVASRPTRRSWPRPPTAMREVLAGVEFREPTAAAPRQRRRPRRSSTATPPAPSSSST